MTLPRFSDGKIGALEFSHLNEAFNSIDDLVRASRIAAEVDQQKPRVITAIIGATVDASGFRREWSEVELTLASGTAAPAYTAKPSPLNSTGNGASALTYPVIGTFTTGQIVSIVAQYSKIGELFYLPVSAAAATGTSFPAKVESSSGGTAGIFTYSCKEVEGAAFSYVSGAVAISARNGAETAVDTASSLGVGFIPPTPSPILTRKAIKVGTVVLITQDKLGLYSFCVPNGYKVEC
jgi:hypothetical protein